MSLLDSLLKNLSLDKENPALLDTQNPNWKKSVPLRLHKGLEELNVNKFLVHKNRIVALFFDSQDINSEERDIFKKIWNLGGVPIVFLIKSSVIDIFNGFSFDSKTSLFERLTIGGKYITESNINENISIWDILSGKGYEKLSKPTLQVDEMLLRNLEETKKILISEGLHDIDAQNLIGRLLFTRFLIDREVNIDNTYFDYKDKNTFLNLIKDKSKLYEYFEYLKVNFNGDLFPLNSGEKDRVHNNHLSTLVDLFSGNKIAKGITQFSLFDSYNFKIIPIELISEVYERFMGKKKKKLQSAYYTPSFLVDYIIEKSIKQHLTNKKTFKVFDPSCGSGIFLVESLRYLIENNLDAKGRINEIALTKLLTENIFGVDIDETVINLAAFSLCLTLLDYIDPKDITKFKFPSLKEKNLFTADFFDLKHHFNLILKNKKIDFILGNPPWGSKHGLSDSNHVAYVNNINKDKDIISDFQIAQSFIIRTKDFSDINTQCVLVLPSKPILYNYNAKDFRKYWLDNYIISEILELSPVRDKKYIFKDATAPTIVTFFSYGFSKQTDNNIIKHTSIKPNIFLEYLKLLVIEKNDIKDIQQSYFKQFDWLWKVMLYGNVLDFYFIKRLKENYLTINQIIKNYNLTSGVGLKRVDGERKTDTTEYIGTKFLDLQKDTLNHFSAKTDVIWYDESVGNLPSKDLFKPPYALIKRGFNRKDFLLVSAYSEEPFLFTDSVTAIKGELSNSTELKSIVGTLNSDIHSYLLLLQGVYAGVEREKSLDKPERFEFPIIINSELSTMVDAIQDLYSKTGDKSSFKLPEIEVEIKAQLDGLNKLLIRLFDISNLEKKLIDYAKEVTIPLINKSTVPLRKTTKAQQEDYLQIFIEHFGSRWSKSPSFFEIDVYSNNYIVGINFKIVGNKPNAIVNFYKDKNIQELFQIMKLGQEKITDLFYVQRDIRGFNNDSFYIVKPNQYKNWHPAAAEGDLREFIQSMLDSERINSTSTIT